MSEYVIYELGVDPLPDFLEDIRGHIHNEPPRVFVVQNVDEGPWTSWGVRQVSISPDESQAGPPCVRDHATQEGASLPLPLCGQSAQRFPS